MERLRRLPSPGLQDPGLVVDRPGVGRVMGIGTESVLLHPRQVAAGRCREVGADRDSSPMLHAWPTGPHRGSARDRRQPSHPLLWANLQGVGPVLDLEEDLGQVQEGSRAVRSSHRSTRVAGSSSMFNPCEFHDIESAIPLGRYGGVGQQVAGGPSIGLVDLITAVLHSEVTVCDRPGSARPNWHFSRSSLEGTVGVTQRPQAGTDGGGVGGPPGAVQGPRTCTSSCGAASRSDHDPLPGRGQRFPWSLIPVGPLLSLDGPQEATCLVNEAPASVAMNLTTPGARAGSEVPRWRGPQVLEVVNLDRAYQVSDLTDGLGDLVMREEPKRSRGRDGQYMQGREERGMPRGAATRRYPDP